TAMADAVVVLHQNYRSQKDILAVARAVNARDWSTVSALLNVTPQTKPENAAATLRDVLQAGGCRFIDMGTDDYASLHQALDVWAEAHFLEKGGASESYAELVARCLNSDLRNTGSDDGLLTRLFERLDAARVLTVVREGPLGAAGVNDYLDDS